DADLYEAFDMEYDYDLWESFTKYLRGESALSAWISLLNLQDFAYPSNYNKLRFLENHDRPRIASQIADAAALESFTCMLYFLKGATMIYGGQEKSCAHLPALFDKDDIDWESGPDISALLAKLAQIKKKYLAADDLFYAVSDDGSNTAFMVRRNAEAIKIGIFPLSRKNAEMRLELPAGEYLDLILGEKQYLDNNLLVSDGNPKILVKNL
ncbi:MAG: alpha-amylase, partial [Firmicutes bacterium]|nr:alpha-amylase [Bacillota bacterium]